MHITKMQGLGNDYLYVFGEAPENVSEIAKRLSHRHFGIGSDGMVFINPSCVADFKMRIFNADGSEALMCGNGIRCVGKYVFDKGYTQKTEITVETLSGIKKLSLFPKEGKIKSVRVDMGIPVVEDDLKMLVNGEEIALTPVSVGNPHGVIFVPDAEKAFVEDIGKCISVHPFFPNGVNVEFVSVLGENRLRMRVWERGSGITMACGTGACAGAVAAMKKGFCNSQKPVSVMLDGGELKIEIAETGNVFMTGPCETVFECDIDLTE